MSVINYIQKMGKVSKDDILKHLNYIQIANDSLRDKSELIKVNNINLVPTANSWYISKNLSTLLNKQFGPKYNIQYLIADSHAKIAAIVDYATAYFQKGKNVYISGTITIKEAELLQLTDNLDYWLDYADILLDALITFLVKDKIENKYVNKADINFLDQTKGYFASIGGDLVKPVKEIINNLNGLSNDVADEENIAILISLGKDMGNDETKQGFIHYFNPYYYIKSMFANMDLNKLTRLKNQNEMFAIKIEQLSNKKQGMVDPNIDRQIEVYQNEIIKNRAEEDAIRKKYYD